MNRIFRIKNNAAVRAGVISGTAGAARAGGVGGAAGAVRAAAAALGALAAILLAGCSDLDDTAAARHNARAPISIAERERAQSQGIDLTNVGFDLGDPAAPVTVVEFSDFGCQFCGSFARESFPTIREEFIATGKVRWKYIPYVLGIFPNGDRAAIAGECAAEQGEIAFWKMHDMLYDKQNEWKSQGGGARALFARYAAQLQLDQNRFLACYDQNRPAAEIARNDRLGKQLSVRATPTFFINGARVEGAIPLPLFKQVLNEAAEK